MSIINNLATSLEEIYLQREKIPGLWNRITGFYADNVWKDLIDLGEKVHMIKQTNSPKHAIASTFFPRTVRNFKKFDKEINEFMDSFEEEEETEEVKEEKPVVEEVKKKPAPKLLYRMQKNGKPLNWNEKETQNLNH